MDRVEWIQNGYFMNGTGNHEVAIASRRWTRRGSHIWRCDSTTAGWTATENTRIALLQCGYRIHPFLKYMLKVFPFVCIVTEK
jgi:hypothetical protein